MDCQQPNDQQDLSCPGTNQSLSTHETFVNIDWLLSTLWRRVGFEMQTNRMDQQKALFQELQNKCAEEPIHVPGAIQPYSCLLILDQNLKIKKYSQNILDVFSLDKSQIVDHDIFSLFDEKSCNSIKRNIEDGAWGDANIVRLVLVDDKNEIEYPSFIHSVSDAILIELEIPAAWNNDRQYDPKADFTQALLRSETVDQQQELLVNTIRQLTKHDRVFLYMFDEEWNGEVVAESSVEGSETFLGLHFPASDIPKQARELYSRKAMRYIPHVGYVAQRICPDDLHDNGQPIDLSVLNSRSISPIHQEYMMNMGISGSLSFGIFENDKLCGLVICHSDHPTFVSPTVRSAATNLTLIYSALLSVPDKKGVRQAEQKKQHCMAALAHSIRHPNEQDRRLDELYGNLLNFMGACGAIFSVGENRHVSGKVPSGERLDLIVDGLKALEVSGVFSSNSIEEDIALDRNDHEKICGMLAFPVPNENNNDFIIWFREQDVVERNWAGQPVKQIENDAGNMRILPRKDFQAWKQIFERHSKAWGSAEKKFAEDVAHIALAITQLVLSQERNQILLQAIESCEVGISLADVNQQNLPLTYVNQAYLDQTGYQRDDVLGQGYQFLQGEGSNPETVQMINTAVTEFKPLDVEILNYKKNGEPFWNHLRMTPVHGANQNPLAVVGIQSDVTAVHQQLRLDQERQKLEALGRMTGNISHEIKNTLQPVKLMADMLKDWKDLDEKQTDRCIDILSENIVLADHVIQDILRFAKKTDNKTDKIYTNDLKKEVINFIQNLIHSRVEFQQDIREIPEADAFVEINLNNLYQVLMNIVNNALQVMNDKGTITLQLDCKQLDAVEALDLGLSAGTYIAVCIEDTGCGMDEKTMRAAFDPFFSTKPPGEGTGLGLSISYRIVKEWNGIINIRSKINVGSAFTIFLPVKFEKMVA